MKYNLLTPIADDVMLWKYMGIAEFLSLLTRKKLYFSNLSSYEDVFEGMLLLEQIQERTELKVGGYDEEQERFRNEKKQVIVNCWNQSNYENYHLWKNYDKSSGYGVAIKTNMKKLKSSFIENYEDDISELQVSHVIYDPYPYLEVKDDLIKRITNKSPSYNSENEIRIFQTNLDSKVYVGGYEFEINPNILIDGIVTSPFAPRWFTMQLIYILKQLIDIDIRRIADKINVSKIKIV